MCDCASRDRANFVACRPILLKNAVGGRGTATRARGDLIDRFRTDDRGFGKGSMTPERVPVRALCVFFNRIGQEQSFALLVKHQSE